jgi:hypothetical protein
MELKRWNLNNFDHLVYFVVISSAMVIGCSMADFLATRIATAIFGMLAVAKFPVLKYEIINNYPIIK